MNSTLCRAIWYSQQSNICLASNYMLGNVWPAGLAGLDYLSQLSNALWMLKYELFWNNLHLLLTLYYINVKKYVLLILKFNKEFYSAWFSVIVCFLRPITATIRPTLFDKHGHLQRVRSQIVAVFCSDCISFIHCQFDHTNTV